MKLKLTWLLTLFMAFVMQFSFAQEKTVTGTVTTADDGLPLPGASVIVKGTSRGAQTDFDGKYSIGVNTGDVLEISYVGMKTAEVTIGASNTYDVALELDNALEEVVVIGYGTTTKKAYAGTAKVVNNEDIETKNFSNVSQSLAGEAAGVTVINTSGQPGTTSTVRIRGFGSINGNRAPLYVIDGVPYTGSLNAINPADIKSTTILKDATATAIYGSRGANGVVLITTKGGSSTESYVELDVRTGVNAQLIPRYDVITSPEESIAFVWEGLLGRGQVTGVADPVAFANNTLFTPGMIDPAYNMWNVADGGELIDPVTRAVRDGVTRRYTPLRYEDAAFDAAYRTEANLRMAGGNADSRYFVSFGFLDDDGYAKNTGFKRYTTRINVNSNVKEWLTLGANIGYAYSQTQNNGQTAGSENVFEFADKMQPFFPVFLRDQNYQLVPDPIFGGFQYDYGSASVGPSSPNPTIPTRSRTNANLLNPIGTATLDFVGTDRHEMNGSFTGKIKFTDDLTFETTFGAQYSNSIFKSVGNPFYGTARNDGGNITQTNTERLTLNFLQLLRYRRDFGNHSLEALVAHEGNKFETNFHSTFKTTVVNPDIDELNQYIVQPGPSTGGRSARTLESYFGQVNYDFDDTYYLTLSARRDGSSKFAFNKWETFYSVGGAWIISNEDFMSDSFINFLKLKASYGKTGDEAGVGFYTGIDTFSIANNGSGGFAFPANTFENPDLTWETAIQYQAGLEFSLGTWLDGSIDYFIKDTENLFFTRTNTISTGVATLTINEGVLRNNGLEFDFTGHVINTDDFKLDLSVNGAFIDNEIKEMYISPQTGEQEVLDTRNAPYGYSVGSSIFDFYIREWAGVDPSDGAPMWYQYYDDQNNNGVLDSGEELNVGLTQYLASTTTEPNIQRTITKTYSNATEKYVGKSGIPDVSGAFRISAKYKNWNLSTQFTYQIGGYALDNQYGELMSDRFGAAGNNYSSDIRARWQQPGDITNVPRLSDNAIVNGTSTSTRFLTKTDFLALNNILVGYTLPSKFLDKTGLDLVNIYVSGDNLWLTSAREGFNPRTSESGNTGRRLYAPLSTFTLGVKLKF
ncbi:SusC/RagA family TonB-linked outer membrane protein [Winogradskyella sp.]|uniref:SusC/RagA family TonB-linked outer membrane protein n=1 Tax=Winogradskyella sp. TaxID=1883156 RepID=UPI001B124B68|nr:SusC/RagA family TonB-linked outer membrane protein [Winogradskyella sp.]MBO6881817.1 SusC/RagA family TonB-linked outer membrane protein [Winogradskyella sp.]